MRISEMIAALSSTMDNVGDIQVMVDGYEGGYDVPGGVFKSISAVHCPDEPYYYGRYQDMEDFMLHMNAEGDPFNAIVIR